MTYILQKPKPLAPEKPTKEDHNSFFVNVMFKSDLIGSFLIKNKNDFLISMDDNLIQILKKIEPTVTYVELTHSTWNYYLDNKTKTEFLPPWRGEHIRYYKEKSKNWHYFSSDITIFVSDFFNTFSYEEAVNKYLEELKNYEIKLEEFNEFLKKELMKYYKINEKTYNYFFNKYSSISTLIKELDDFVIITS